MKSMIVIGGGVAGLAASCALAHQGASVTLLEKHGELGGRTRTFSTHGFTFDMGPSWYWMPDVFERFFQRFGHSTSDFYELVRLDPSYRVFFDDDTVDIPANMDELRALFESWEDGAGRALDAFLGDAEKKYRISMDHLVYTPALSITEFMRADVVRSAVSMRLFSSFERLIRTHFKHPRILSLLEFPILFLGATAKTTPALYSIMNYADMALGTWYPMGGMHRIIEAMATVAKELGVRIEKNAEVERFDVEKGRIRSAVTSGTHHSADVFIATADYHHVDQHLLDAAHRMYSKPYWDKRTLAPSCLLFYLGLDTKVSGLLHHNLFFDADLTAHSKSIYRDRTWPDKPLFYVCCPSKTDPSVAPSTGENLFLLMPIAPGIADSEAQRSKYFEILMDRLEKRLAQSIRPHIVYKRSYCIEDFKTDYHAFKGNAYGLANTLRQTAIFKPRMQSRKLPNLYFAGQLTVPGPGLPPAIISGQIAADLVIQKHHR